MNMKKLSIPLILAVVLLAVPTRANADLIFTATINSAQEVPTNPSHAFGFAVFILNDAMTALFYSATIVGLDFTGLQSPDDPLDNLVAMHIHAPGPPGVNAGVVFGFLNPNNDINPADRVITPFLHGVGGTVSGKWDLLEGNNTTLAAQLPSILAGNSYINFHTVQFPGGEIRGQIIPQQVPEPATLFLLGAGLIGLGTLAWRKGRRE